MRTYEFGKNQFYESAQHHHDWYPREGLERHVSAVIGDFIKRRLFRELLELYGNQNDLEGYILLNAHGVRKSKKWMFADGKKRHSVQKWIDKRDGSCLAMLLCCCNPRNYEIHSEKSVVIHPKDAIGIVKLVRGGHLRMYVPGEGYLEDNHYRLRKAIEKLECSS